MYAETPRPCYTKDKREVGQQPQYSVKESSFIGNFPTNVSLWVEPCERKGLWSCRNEIFKLPKISPSPWFWPSFLSVLLVFVCGCLWMKNETTNKRLIALQSRIDYLPCVKRVSFERMTRSSTKVTLKDLYKKVRTLFSAGIAHNSGKMLHE